MYAILKSLPHSPGHRLKAAQTDGDGVAEEGGALKNTGGDIDPLLPEDERERRRTGARRAKWAININVIANVILLIAKVHSSRHITYP